MQQDQTTGSPSRFTPVVIFLSGENPRSKRCFRYFSGKKKIKGKKGKIIQLQHTHHQMLLEAKICLLPLSFTPPSPSLDKAPATLVLRFKFTGKRFSQRILSRENEQFVPPSSYLPPPALLHSFLPSSFFIPSSLLPPLSPPPLFHFNSDICYFR